MESSVAKECLDQITIGKRRNYNQFFPNIN
jgi:hypothetical protein